MPETSVIWSKSESRVTANGRPEAGYFDADEPPAGPAGSSRAQPDADRVPGRRARHGREKARHGIAWRLLAVGGSLAALAVAALVMPGALRQTDSAPPPPASLKLHVAPPAATALPSSGLEAIPGSLATAEIPRPKATREKAAAKKSSPTPAATTVAPVPPSSAPAAGGTVTDGDSKAHCVIPSFPGGVLSQSILQGITSVTGITYNCLSTFANPMPTWSDWEAPWMFSTVSDGWDAWLASSPAHQAIMGMDLIPQAVADNDNPLSWEQPCANGDYNQYATTLANNLVSYGAGKIVIRLGIEANGSWEADYVGTTGTEMSDWGKCYANEVTAMRAVPGAHFTFVWNPNICTADIPISKWYPGDSVVDIIGADAYDTDCGTLKTVAQEGFTAYSTDSSSGGAGDPDFPSLANIESFAKSHGKPMSFPEWGLGTGDDDPAYVTSMAQMFNSDDFAFESYFNSDDDGIATLGASVPQATAAYRKAFG